jgi:2-polyprenyl-3-methyl-5-hydroxy-6-metoxy-1,4-benzoquinol methylase
MLDHRQAAVHNTCAKDVCLEVGCHAGVTLNIVSNRCTWVLGVDTAAEVIEVARNKYVTMPCMHQSTDRFPVSWQSSA